MKNNRFNLWKCSPGATFFAALLAILFLGTGCSDFDPLDSYSRIPPDRSQNDDEEGGGLFESGYGTESEPYVIVNAEQLQRMANALVSDKFVYFQLGADIDMSGIENWTPLNSIDPYNKFISFDGNNHVIKNFSCSGKSYSSFFGVIDTDMNRCFDEAERQALADGIPCGRFASPEEAAAFCCQIAESPEYLTGQVLRFDGGWI